MYTSDQIMSAILPLAPNSKFMIWECDDLSHYHGENPVFICQNFYLDWQDDTTAAPTPEQILANIAAN